MSTTRGANNSLHWVFKDRRKRTGQCKKYTAFPESKPYRRSIRFQGGPKKNEDVATFHSLTVKKKRELFPGHPPASPVSFALPLIIHVLVQEY